MSVTSQVFRALTRLLPARVGARDAEALCAVYDELDAEAHRMRGWVGAVTTLAT